MSEDTRTLQPVRFPRYERHGLFMGLQWYQLTLIAAGTLVAVVTSATGGPAAFILTAPLWLGIILFGVLHYARIPYPVWAYTASLFFLRSVLNETRYLARPEQARKTGTMELPGGLGSLELRRTSKGEAFMVDHTGHEAIVALRCTTNSFALMDGDDKAYAVQAWSRVQAAMARRPAVARIAIQDYTVPYPSSALRAYYERAVPPERIADAEWGDQSYLDLIEAAGASMSHEIIMAVVLDTAKGRRRIKDAGGGMAGLESVLRSEVESFTTGLKTHGVVVTEWLSDAAVTAVVRGSFDPAAVAKPVSTDLGWVCGES